MSIEESGSPKQLGDFQILSKIGQGGMGTVYRAMQVPLGREVALKCLSRSGDAGAEARFLREIRALGMVSHPHLVKVYASGSVEGQCYFAMEIVNGADLSSISDALRDLNRPIHQLGEKDWQQAFEAAAHGKSSTSSPPSTAMLATTSGQAVPEVHSPQARSSSSSHGYALVVAEVVRQIADAVAALHRSGIVHRDIKPGNIMVRIDGTDAVLMDLGLAHISDDAESRLTRTQQFVGTLRYASPEQVLAADKVDARSDVYSLGATLWELLTLRPLYGADSNGSTYDLMQRIEYDDPPSVRMFNPSIPQDLAAIAGKCLQKNPRRRYQNASELAADLQRFVHGDVVTARPLTTLQRAANVISRHPLHAASLALTAIAVLLTYSLVSFRSQLITQQRHNHELTVANDRADRSFRDAVHSLNGIFEMVTEGELRQIAELQPLQGKLLEYYEGYIRQHDAGAAFQLDLADARARVGRIRQESGNIPQALADYAESLRMSRNVLTSEPGSLDAIKGISNVLISIAGLLIDQRDYSSASQHLREAGETLDRVDRNEDPVILRLHAEVHHATGVLHMHRGQSAASVRELVESLRLRQELYKHDSGVLSQRDLGRGYGYLGDVQVELGDYASAEESYTSSMDWREKVSRQLPESHEASFQLARASHNLGYLARLRGRQTEALTFYRRAVERHRKLKMSYPAITSYASDFALDSAALGDILLTSGDLVAATACLQEARDTAVAILERNPANMANASIAFQAAVLLAKAGRASNHENWKPDMELAGTLSSRLKEFSPDDLFYQALLTRMRQTSVNVDDNLEPSSSKPAENSEVTDLLERAVRESPHTIGSRIKREEAFDPYLIPSWNEQAKFVAATGERSRGMKQQSNSASNATTRVSGVCIGISQYQNESLRLKWASQDAVELSTALKGGGRQGNTDNLHLLIDHNATRERILETLAELRDSSDENTLSIVHLSGHGLINPLGEYYFAPYEFNPEKGISSSGLSWYDIEQEVKRMHGTVLIILDTCHSGAAVTGGTRGVLAGIMDRTVEEIIHHASRGNSGGTVVLSSALTGQLSLEADDWGHGPLTLAVIEALTHKHLGNASKSSRIELPAFTNATAITMESLRNYSVARVNELTNGRQRVICRNSVDLLNVFINGAK